MFDVDAQLVGNESAHIIGGKDFSHSRCLWTRSQAGDGHDKAPESVKRLQRTMKSALQCGSRKSCPPLSDLHGIMQLQNRRSRQATYRAVVADGPHCSAMW